MTLITNNGRKAHIRFSGSYYIASDNGKETLIFPSNAKGEIVSLKEVGGGFGHSLSEVIGNFGSFLHLFR